MSDGGKEFGKHFQQHYNCSTAGKEDFVRSIAKIAVAQICENEGFQGFHNSALEAFADVALQFVMELGKTCNLYANSGGGRSECNVFDVILGLENLGSVQGFSGASGILHHSIAKSGSIKEISQYVSLVEAMPFVFSLPRFPVSRERMPPLSFLQMGMDPPHHIPPWLPAFTCMEAARNVPVVKMNAHKGSKEDEQRYVNVDQQQQKQEHQQLTANNGSEAVEINPFLASPFAFGEKEVSLIEAPGRTWEGNHVYLMDTFALVEETARNEVTEVEDMSKDMKLDERPSIRFKFSDSRKSLRMNIIAQTNGEDETISSLFERNDENDEKKRRAEQILKESMETPLDTTEL